MSLREIFRSIDLRTVLWNSIVAAAYVAFAKVGFSLAFTTQQVTAVWPPAGIAVAALLLLGYRILPGIWLGAFASNAMTHEPVVTAALIAVGNAGGPLLGAYLLRRAGFDSALERVRDIVLLVLFGSALAMTVTATNGVANLALAGIVPWAKYASIWSLWWVGDSMGVLVTTPLILVWARLRRPLRMSARSILERAVFAVALGGIAFAEFLTVLPLSFSLYPFVIWSALRFGQRATTLAIASISGLAIVGTLRNLGPFSVGLFDHRLSLLVTYMAVLGITGLVLGAVTAERRLAQSRLEEAEHRFQAVAEVVPQMVWTADKNGWIDWFNHRWYEYTGQSREKSAGWGWTKAYHPDEIPRVMQDWPRSIATGESFEREARIRRADGAFRWFLARAEPSRDSTGAIARWYGTYTDIDAQKRALQQSRRVAETLQAAFLPGELPVRAGLRFDALYLPAEQDTLVGGDWYDAVELPDGRVLVSIGDVMGHGVGASVAAQRIKHAIFATAMDGADPATILNKINAMLSVRDGVIATALVAIIDPDLGRMRYASAGHPPPVLASPSADARLLPLGGVPLGIEDIDLANHPVLLERDAVVVFYTDGMTEFKRDIDTAETLLQYAAHGLVGYSDALSPALEVARAVLGGQRPADDAVVVVLQLATPVVHEISTDGALRRSWAFDSADAYTARLLRHELTSFIRRHVQATEDLFRAELVIGELLANTVEHAPGPVSVGIDWTNSRPVLTVSDCGPGLERFDPSLPENKLDESGRGLYLISALASDVRAEHEADRGTTMHVTLPIRRNT